MSYFETFTFTAPALSLDVHQGSESEAVKGRMAPLSEPGTSDSLVSQAPRLTSASKGITFC